MKLKKLTSAVALGAFLFSTIGTPVIAGEDIATGVEQRCQFAQ